MLGMHVRLACPEGYAPAPAELEAVEALGAASVAWSPVPEEAVKGANAVHTDVWTSMGQEAEQQARLAAFRGYTVTEALMEQAASDAVFLHCMPAHRGEEVSAEVMDGPRSHAITQGHNRMHAARGLLALLFGGTR